MCVHLFQGEGEGEGYALSKLQAQSHNRILKLNYEPLLTRALLVYLLSVRDGDPPPPKISELNRFSLHLK